MSRSYIGADVDSKMIELAVERKSKIVARDRIPTNIKSIRKFLKTICGPKVMIIEEGPMAGWLYRNLRDNVDKFVVCDPRRNKSVYADGDKTDRIDAEVLAGLERGGYTREVYHTVDEGRLALKEVVALYHDRKKDAVRQVNKLRAAGRGFGVRIPSTAINDPLNRDNWLKDLDDSALAKRLSILLMGLDTVRLQVKLAKTDISHRARVYSIIGYWQEIVGIGLIRAATLLAYLDTPWRFSKTSKLWKYCGLGLRGCSRGWCIKCIEVNIERIGLNVLGHMILLILRHALILCQGRFKPLWVGPRGLPFIQDRSRGGFIRGCVESSTKIPALGIT